MQSKRQKGDMFPVDFITQGPAKRGHGQGEEKGRYEGRAPAAGTLEGDQVDGYDGEYPEHPEKISQEGFQRQVCE